MENKVTFRNAERKDTGLILQFVKELAAYEDMSDEWLQTKVSWRHGFLTSRKRRWFLLLWTGRKSVLHCSSITFLPFLDGQAFIWRLVCNAGISWKRIRKSTFEKLASIAVERGCGRFEWVCLDWNKPSIDFYLSLGAEPQADWTIYRMSGDTLTKFAEWYGMCLRQRCIEE